jgi:hypothetical protein
MQNSHHYNSSPRSVALCNRDIQNDKRTLCVINDSFCSLHCRVSTTVNDFCFVEKRDDVSGKKSTLTSMDKKHKAIEKLKNDIVVVSASKPKQVVYKTAMQAFMQQLHAEQTHGSNKNLPFVDDSFFTMVPQQQQTQLLDSGSLPDLNESYTSSDLTATTEHSGDHDEYRYDTTTTLGDIDYHHVKYIDLPPLIDSSREMRTFM